MSLTRIALLLCLTGCAHAPGALGTARCLLASPAVDALTEDPTRPTRPSPSSPPLPR